MREGFDLPPDAPGRYIPLREDQPFAKAYYPDPLPPTLELADEIIEELTKAMHALGRLDGVGSEVDNPGAVFSSFVYKEAEQSSQIEGTKVTVSDIYRYEIDEIEPIANARSERERQDIREAKNYIQALRDATEHLRVAGRARENITLELIKSIHETLMEDGRTAEDDPHPGEFRPGYAYIEDSTAPWKRGIRFIPPKSEMAISRMQDLGSYIRSSGRYPDLVDIALIHYQFETIHPFKDGNGRVGRLLIVLLLMCCGILINPLLYLSSYFKRHRDEYADLLLNVSERGRWDEWVLFFLSGIHQQAEEAFVRAKLLLRKREQYREAYSDAPRSVSRLVENVFSEPYFTVAEAREIIDMTYQSANSAIASLVDDGVLTEITGKRKYRVFEAQEIMDIIERPAESLPNPAELIDNGRRDVFVAE